MKKFHCNSTGFFKKAALMAAVGIAGCGRHSNHPSMSDIKHNINEPTRGANEGLWLNLNDEQYKKVVLPLAELSGATVLPAEHDLAKRMQFWLDEFDQALRKSNPELFANVPKPVAKVVVSEDSNAFVAGAPVCYNVRVDVPARKAGAAVTTASRSAANGFVPLTDEERENMRDRRAAMHPDLADILLLDVRTGELVPFSNVDLPACVEGGADKSEVEKILTYVNSHMKECRYKLQTDGRVLGNQACADQSSALGAYQSASRLMVIRPANTVTILTGLISSMTEEEVVGVVAHELAHYYRDHASAPKSLYNYFYTLGRRNPGQKPEPEANLQEQGQKAIDASKALAMADVFARLPEQKLNSELYLATTRIVQDTCQSGECNTACATANKRLEDSAYQAALGRFPYVSTVSEEGKKAYTAFETEALACLESVAFSADENQTAKSGLITWPLLKKKITELHFPKSWSPSLFELLDLFKKAEYTSERLQEHAPQAENTANLLLSVSEHLTGLDAKTIEALRNAYDSHLGYYTDEQEADELAIEWLAKLGLSPQKAIDAMRALYKSKVTTHGGLKYGKDKCEQLYAKNWLDTEGRYLFVPLGDFTDDHHQLCYRMFNMDREIETHAITPVSREEKLSLDLDAWDVLRSEAERLSKADTSVSTK